MTGTGSAAGDSARRYRHFADAEARGHSPIYQALAAGVSGDAELVALVDQLPRPKRQPNLLLATVRFLDGPVTNYGSFREWTVEHWSQVASTMVERRTQTNEPGRCATLLPLLASLPQPLALIEVGASAGLCLYPDRYHYRYDDGPGIGPQDSPVSLLCRTSGPVPLPDTVPAVVWRAGIGDLNDAVGELIGQAPPGATPVVFHSSVLAYLSDRDRLTFAATIRDLPGHWISNEAASALPSVQRQLRRPAPRDRVVNTLALDEQPVAFAGPHGEDLHWFTT